MRLCALLARRNASLLTPRPPSAQHLRGAATLPLHRLVSDANQSGKDGAEGTKLLASRDISAGDVIFREPSVDVVAQPDMHSIMIGMEHHLVIHSDARFLSHSFSPNCYVRVIERATHPVEVVAVHEIAASEELSFNYHTVTHHTVTMLLLPSTSTCHKARAS